MQKPDFQNIATELKKHAQNLQDNGRIGESKIVLAFAEMVPVMEWSSSQQNTNNSQIANLTEEIKTLKSITDKNAESSNQSARSSNKLARIAIGIAIATLVVQVLFSTHQEKNCLWPGSVNSGDPGFAYYSGCYRQFDFGLLGIYTMQLSDYRVPINQN